MAFGLFIVRLFLGVPFIIWGIGKLRGGDARIAPLIAGSEHRGNATEILKNIIVADGYFALVAAGGGAVSLCGGAAPGILSWLP